MNITFPSVDIDEYKTVGSDKNLIELTQLAIHEWISVISCEKCGRKNVCLYRGADQNDICKIMQTFIANIFSEVNDIYCSKSDKEKENILKSMFSLVQFVFEAELYTGYFLIPNFIEDVYGKGISRKVIGSVVDFKKHIESFLRLSKDIVEFESKPVVILTEGASEAAFIRELYPYASFEVEDYDGEGNKRSGKLLPLMRRYARIGYEVFAQSDLDGKSNDKNGFSQYIGNGSLNFTIGHTFAFEYNLEQSYPVELLYVVLKNSQCIVDDEISYESFKSHMDNCLNRYEKLNEIIDAVPSKVKLAQMMAKAIRYGTKKIYEVVGDTELGKFIEFVKKATDQT